MTNVSNSAEEMPPRGSLIVGGTLFLVGWLCPLFVPVVAACDLPTAWKAAASGVLLVGLPELLTLAAIAVLGQSGYQYLKGRLLTALKRYGPPESVGPTRYKIGLVLFVVPLFLGFLEPYLGHLVPGLAENRVVFCVACDLLFLSSLFVLGGEFWDKLRALFVHGATTRFPERTSPPASLRKQDRRTEPAPTRVVGGSSVSRSPIEPRFGPS